MYAYLRITFWLIICFWWRILQICRQWFRYI